MNKWVVLGLGLLVPGLVIADEEKGGDMNVQMSGYFLWDFGYANELQDKDAIKFNNEPFAGMVGGLTLSARPSDNLFLMINPEFQGHSIFPVQPAITGAPAEGRQTIKWGIHMEEGKNVWTLGGTPERPLFQNTLGLMVYKDNPDTKLFGDYLLRSQIYPTMITTNFNYAKTQIFGAHIRNNLGDMFSHNLLVTSDFEHYPFYDISIAYTANARFKNLFDVGLGVNFKSAIPIRTSRTTPHGGEGLGVPDNTYKFIPFQEGTQILDSAGAVARIVSVRGVTLKNSGGADSAAAVIEIANGPAGTPISSSDTVKVAKGGGGVEGLGGSFNTNDNIPHAQDLTVGGQGIGDLYPALHGKSIPFSFAGQIFTARASFSPMGFLETNPLGKDALKIYAEAAVLGWKNYPFYYDDRRQRIPVMFGINLPTMNFLDYLSVEAEYFPSKTLPSTWYRYEFNVPQPGMGKHGTRTVAEWSDPTRATEDDWKWAVMARRTFRAFSFVAQVGTDHMRPDDADNLQVTDMLTRSSHWYARVRFITGFY